MAPPGQDSTAGDPDGADESRPRHEGPGVPPPAERAWRHPSELTGSASGSSPGTVRSGTANADPWVVSRHRRRLRLMGAVGTAAATAAVAAMVLLWESASSTPGGSTPVHAVTTDVLTVHEQPVPETVVPAMRSLVALWVGTPRHRVEVCGMAVGGDGLVAAPARPLEQAGGTIRLATSRGTTPATEVAVDSTSDVALVRVPTSLSPPAFADDGAMAPGRSAVVLSVTEAGGGATSIDWSNATIASVASGAGSNMATIVADVHRAPKVCGALLLDSHGAVVGLLGEATGTAHGGADVFLPAALVKGVTDQLALRPAVRHGWLDVSGDDTALGGVLVGSVDPGGAAAGMLESGDVIVAISGEPVRSMAELRTRLYVLPPGASVALDVVRHGRHVQVDVQLGGSP